MPARQQEKDPDLKTVSYSALDLLKSCPQQYRYRYIDKLEYTKTLENYFLIGSWTHDLIEKKLLEPDMDVMDSFIDSLEEWLSDLGVYLDADELTNAINISVDLSQLLYRASAHCNDNTKIRNSNGTVLKNPIDYPSNSFKSELSRLKTYKYKSMIDQAACRQNPELLKFSLVWCLAMSLHLSINFKIPKGVTTVSTEMPFGLNRETFVPLGDTDCSLLGYIDWVMKLSDGRIAIIDHKTSNSIPLELDVLYHPQLNLYAYAYKVLTGDYPQMIGIHHVKTGRMIFAEANEKIIRTTVDYYEELYKSSLLENVIRKHPGDYNSPCLKRDYTSKKVTSVCPYLDKCWGGYKNLLTI